MNTWNLLRTKLIDLDYHDDRIHLFLRDLGHLAGVAVLSTPGLEQERISIKVRSLAADSCLRLALEPRECAYEIRDDGTVFVGPKSQVKGGYERVAQEALLRDNELEQVRLDLKSGWDGIRPPLDQKIAVENVLRTGILSLTEGEITVNRAYQRLQEEFHLNVCVEGPVDSRTAAAREAEFARPFALPIGDQNLGTFVDQLALRLGLIPVVMDHGDIYLCDATRAAAHRAQQEESRRAYDQMIRSLDTPLDAGADLPVQDFLDLIGRRSTLSVCPSEDAWESAAFVTLARGATVRQGLDQLRALGFRWAVRDGKIYVVR